ncbi:hypothetical protein EDB81DRAFT_789136 [Dactylonectria macrodidyma]|uniref:Secreted protein n=1 Tax=Dactylonectria macrodidyma TaxID=307937 RepID=A0A9P9JEH5_9HYPO|nr:hypothetical protein EDB81DRAFT_789136 [Dactylonectria macrodidyma]
MCRVISCMFWCPSVTSFVWDSNSAKTERATFSGHTDISVWKSFVCRYGSSERYGREMDVMRKQPMQKQPSHCPYLRTNNYDVR